MNEIPMSLSQFKATSKISEKNLKEFLQIVVNVINFYFRENESEIEKILYELSEECQEVLIKGLKKMKIRLNRDGGFNTGDKLLDINWNIEKEVFSSYNGPKEELIVNMNLTTEKQNSSEVENLDFCMQKEEFGRFYQTLTKLRDFSMNLLNQNA